MINVNWLKNNSINYLDADGMNSLITDLEKSKLRKIPFYSFKRLVACYKTWCLKASKDNVIVRVVKGYDDIKQYVFSLNDAGGPREEITGKMAFDMVNDIFSDTIEGKRTLYTAFSGDKYKTRYKQIKRCVPKQISMIDKTIQFKKLKHVYKADISSAYPAEGSKSLPCFEKHKFITGTIQPSKDYPFAFYIRSGHMAIYNEFDTHSWKNKQNLYTLYKKQFFDLPLSEDITILCKESEYSLEETFKIIYDRKLNGDKIAKIGMNAAIGYFQKNTNPKLSHLSAVIIGRCCNRIIQLSEALTREKNYPIFIATDSIAWVGKESKLAEDEKYLGSFSYEYKDVEFYGTGPKAYQIKDKTGKIKTVYAGMKNGEEKSNIPFGKLPENQGMERYLISSSGKITTINF